MESSQNLLSSDLQVDIVAAGHLKETAMWARLLAVVGFVLSIIIGILALFAGTILSNMTRGFGRDTAASASLGAGFIMIVYLIIAAVYFFMSLFLYKFAIKMKQALLTSDQENFNASLLNLKLLYRTMGIILVIYLSILALALIVGVIAAAFMR